MQLNCHGEVFPDDGRTTPEMMRVRLQTNFSGISPCSNVKIRNSLHSVIITITWLRREIRYFLYFHCHCDRYSCDKNEFNRRDFKIQLWLPMQKNLRNEYNGFLRYLSNNLQLSFLTQ